MDFTLGTPALLFPAISLLMLAYTNRFLALANVVRMLKAKHENKPEPDLLRQIHNLIKRINLIKGMQALGVAAMLLCVVSMELLFTEYPLAARWSFGTSLVLMTASLLISLWEIMMSGTALKIELEDLRTSVVEDQHIEDKVFESKRITK
jgi:hypothetical protein